MLKIFKRNIKYDYQEKLKKAFPEKSHSDLNVVLKILLFENDKWFRRKSNDYPEFYFIKDVITVLPHYNDTKEDFIIKSSIFLKLIYSLFFCFGLFFWSKIQVTNATFG